jgi:NAD(P)-dependent dehydrogenase (short-subunit alcohol dehydrogenase family)
MPTLKDRVALVTGAGSGIGEAVVRRFLAEGAKVVFTDLDAKKGEALAKVLAETHKGAVAFVAGDHTKAADNAKAVAAAVEGFGSLSILHNNAGVPQFGPLDALTEAELRKVLDANVIGPFLMTQAALPELRKTAKAGKDAAIVFTASVQSIAVAARMTAYGASKHGVAGLSGALALELAREGIRVNSVGPGPVDTPLMRSVATGGRNDHTAGLDAMKNTVPMGRFIKAEEVAAAVTFLCGPDASAITGVLLPVDGGKTAR